MLLDSIRGDCHPLKCISVVAPSRLVRLLLEAVDLSDRRRLVDETWAVFSTQVSRPQAGLVSKIGSVWYTRQ